MVWLPFMTSSTQTEQTLAAAPLSTCQALGIFNTKFRTDSSTEIRIESDRDTIRYDGGYLRAPKS